VKILKFKASKNIGIPANKKIGIPSTKKIGIATTKKIGQTIGICILKFTKPRFESKSR